MKRPASRWRGGGGVGTCAVSWQRGGGGGGRGGGGGVGTGAVSGEGGGGGGGRPQPSSAATAVASIPASAAPGIGAAIDRAADTAVMGETGARWQPIASACRGAANRVERPGNAIGRLRFMAPAPVSATFGS